MCRLTWEWSEKKIGQRDIKNNKIEYERKYGAKPRKHHTPEGARGGKGELQSEVASESTRGGGGGCELPIFNFVL